MIEGWPFVQGRQRRVSALVAYLFEPELVEASWRDDVPIPLMADLVTNEPGDAPPGGKSRLICHEHIFLYRFYIQERVRASIFDKDWVLYTPQMYSAKLSAPRKRWRFSETPFSIANEKCSTP